MKKIISILFSMSIFISLTAHNNCFHFNKTNNYSKTNNYNKTNTYSDKTTTYYQIIEVVDWECIQAGKSIKECTSSQKVYYLNEISVVEKVSSEDKESTNRDN